MATVHLGRDAHTSQPVAIKRLHPQFASDPEFVEMLLDEARLAGAIHHPNVIRPLEVVSADDEVFLVMEYVEGEALSRLVKGKKPPPCAVMTAVLSDCLWGLQAAHEATDPAGLALDIVHRDVSPQNILVGADGVARLIDFGVAKASGRFRETRDGAVKGKIAYMAPEYLQSGTVSSQTDVYAAGVVLWELMTGRRLFAGDSEGVVVARILRGDVPSPLSEMLAGASQTLPHLDMRELEALDRVVARAVATSPAERYVSALDMAMDLARAVPPAAPDEVARWVRAVARDVLESRAAMVSDMTRSSDAHTQTTAVSGGRDPAADSLLPIIVADLVDEGARDYLLGVALAHGTVLVPLVTAPADGGDHVLEVHVPGEPEPTLFVARPAGPPEPAGFPLTLSPFGAVSLAREAKPSAARKLEARTHSQHELSPHHSRELSQQGAGFLVEAEVLGRRLQGGRLELVERLGGGGGGSVYRACYDDGRRDVAVKVLHENLQNDLDFCARFHAEALAASKLDHPNLVRIIDFGQEPDGLLYLTMEHLEGASLRELLERDGRLPLERAVTLVMQVCAGLTHAHERGVVHRDVKPSNVILVTARDDDGREVDVAKLCDFGIATEVTVDGDDAHRVTGTPQYMSPEQCAGDAVDERTDVYSAGVMLYELVTGELPFIAGEPEDYLRLHRVAAPTPPSEHVADIDPLLEQVILRALAKRPEDRFPATRDLRRALKELLAPVAVPLEAPPGPESSPRAVSRSPSLAEVAMIAGRIADVTAPAAPPSAPAPPPRPMPPPAAVAPPQLDATRAHLAALASQVAAAERGTPARTTVSPPSASEADRAFRDLAHMIAAAPAETLNAIATRRATPGFAREAELVEGAARELARMGHVPALEQIIRTMAAIHDEATRAGGPPSSAAAAARVLHIIADPSTLTPLAEALLARREPPNEREIGVLAWAKVAGAHALFNARAKDASPTARARFVSTMRALGASATPIVRGALERLAPAPGAPVRKPTIVVDLLSAAPPVRDDALGGVLARFARVPEPEIRALALGALVQAWGERATPVLLANLAGPEDPVRATSLRGLAAVGAVDEFVVRKIGAALEAPASEAMELACADALAATTPGARLVAAKVAVAAASRPRASTRAAVALARAAIAVAPAQAQSALAALWPAVGEPLRSELAALVQSAPAAR